DRRHDHDRLLVLVEGGDRVPEGDELRLEGIESPGDLVRRKGERDRSSGVVNGHERASLYTTPPRAGRAGRGRRRGSPLSGRTAGAPALPSRTRADRCRPGARPG